MRAAPRLEPDVVSEELREALSKIIELGYQLSADGFEYLSTLQGEAVKETVKQAILVAGSSHEDITIINRDLLRSMHEESLRKTDVLKVVTGKTESRPLAAEYDGQIQVMDERPASPSCDLEGFVDYFRSRFKGIEGILRQRMDVREAVTITNALKMPMKSKIKMIGIVTSKRTSGQRLFVELEDNENSVTVLASEGDALKKGFTILEDQVICADAIKYKQDLFIANDFIWPDIPSQTPRRSEIPLCSAFIADTHIGSRYFQRGIFDKFIRWLNLEVGPPQLRNLAAQVKYVVVDGDLVDGIGIYPTQLEELEIKDVRKQYETAALMLSGIPDYVEIIILPGNHDAVRKSLPQPPIPKQYAEALYDDDRIHFLGSPSRLTLNGVEAFVCHGKALDDVLSHVPGMTFNNPLNGMELLLRCRHVAPMYGSSTPIAPEKEDRLIIPSTPDVFQMGHIHVYGSKRYKGTTLIASSSWQDQTPFQKRVNIIPTVGIAPIFNLQTHQVTPIDFKKLG